MPAPRHSRSFRSWFSFVLCAALVAATSAGAAQIFSSTGGRVGVEVNKGTIVRLSRPASTVFIADPDICDIQVKSPRLIYLLGKKPGQTTLFAVDEEESVLANMDVDVSQDVSRLAAAARRLYPDANVNFVNVERSVVMEGAVTSAGMADNLRRLAAQYVVKDTDLINRVKVDAPTQVNLRVRVAEINRTVRNQLGINWSVMGNIAGAGIAFATFNPFAVPGLDGMLMNFSAGKWDVNILLDVLNQEGLVSLLAEPNLTALTGETASFLAGGEFPILVPQGDNQVTIEFKKYGVSLAFTPSIVDSSRINLHVRPEVSELSDEGAIDVPYGVSTIQVKALKVRRAETTIELASGQSFAIGGLLSSDSAHNIRKLPGLGDVPVVGRLFTSDAFLRGETELVIIVTPYVVQPSANASAAPTDGFAPPNDLERLYPGGAWQRASAPGSASIVGPDGARVYGPIGYVLE